MGCKAQTPDCDVKVLPVLNTRPSHRPLAATSLRLKGKSHFLHFLEKQSQWKRSPTRLCFLQNNCGDTNYKGFVVTIAHPAHFSRGTSEEPTKKNQINYSTGNNPEDDRLHQLSNERAAFNLHDCNHRATGVIFLWEMKMFPVWLKTSKETDG